MSDGEGLTFDFYQERASDTAVYPGQGEFKGLAYVSLGVNGEAGEIAEHVKKSWRDDGEITPERRSLILKEVGDELWYLAQLCSELDASLGNAALANLEKLADRRRRNVIHGAGDER